MNLKHTGYSIDRGVAMITIKRPPANAIIAASAKELYSVLLDSNRDPEVKVRIIAGEGRFFCAGLDLKSVDPDNLEPIQNLMSAYLNPIMIHLLGKSKVTIAAVNGPAVGAGAGLAIGCNLTYAAESASLEFPFVRIGLVPDALSTHNLPLLVGPKRAAEILLLGEKIGAKDAERIHLVNAVYPDAELQARVFERARSLVEMDCEALQYTKLALTMARDSAASVVEQAEFELLAQAELLGSPAFREAVRRFVEARQRP